MIEIEKKLNNINKIELSSLAFGLLGISGLIINQPFFTALFPLSSPLIVTALLNRNSIKKENNRSLTEGPVSYFYEKALDKWLEQYLDNSENLTEKKYKFLFVSMWMKQKNFVNYMRNLYYKDKITKIISQLKNEKETIYNFNALLLDIKDEVNVKSILFEDINDKEKIKIAKKVYKDFEHCGLFGESFKFLSSDEFHALSILQDFQILDSDIMRIEKNLTKKTISLFQSDLFIDDEAHSVLDNLIVNQKEKKQLDILEKFLNSWDDFKNKEVYLKKLTSRKLNDQLENNLIKNENEIKNKRIKI